MLVPYVITYELDPPSWLGARKNHIDASTTRETRPLTSEPTVKVMPADGRTPPAETVFRLRTSDHELHADGAGRRRGDRECNRIDVARIRRVLVVADRTDRVVAVHVAASTE